MLTVEIPALHSGLWGLNLAERRWTVRRLLNSNAQTANTVPGQKKIAKNTKVTPDRIAITNTPRSVSFPG
jgi:hypothetical protein